MVCSRRAFLKAAVAGTATLVLPGLFCGKEPQAEQPYDRLSRLYYGAAYYAGITTCDNPSNHFATFRDFPLAAIARELGLHDHARILYPGAGTHLAALEIGSGLARLPRPVRPTFVYTEHESSGMEGATEEKFEKAMAVAEPEFQILGKRKRALPQGYEVTYELFVFGNPMTLAYAINTPTATDHHTYFTDQQVSSADIIVFHDTLPVQDDLLATGVAIVARLGAESSTKKAIIFEDIARVLDGKNKPEIYDLLPGRVLLTRGEYGCLAEGCVGLSAYRGAVIYFPDSNMIRTTEGSERLNALRGLYFCRGAKQNINERRFKPGGGIEAID